MFQMVSGWYGVGPKSALTSWRTQWSTNKGGPVGTEMATYHLT